jgi:hypothetical protein
MIGHIAFWLASFVIALVCLMAAWKVGADGLDEDGNVRDEVQRNWTKMWAFAGIALAAVALVDMYSFFNPPPASIR